LIFRPSFVFLDFDGVIMDSMGLKLESYCHAFDGMGFARADIRRLQLAFAGLSRQKTIALIYRELSGREMPEDLFAAALARFGEHDEESRARMALMPGAAEFLAAASETGVPMAVVTGTPQAAIDRTVAHFRLGRFFVKVCGSPQSKPEHLRSLTAEHSLDPARCLFVGDAIKDQEAAAGAGIPFAGINNGDNPFRPDGLLLEVAGLGALIPFLRA
jgi:HAD superfamily hydrolase (TIGR01509 family)